MVNRTLLIVALAIVLIPIATFAVRELQVFYPQYAVERNDVSSTITWVRRNGLQARYSNIVSGVIESPLHTAVRAGKTRLVESLLKEGVDPYLLDSHDISPLMLSSCIKDGSASDLEVTNMINTFVSNGADLSKKHGPDGMTPLHYAASIHSSRAVKVLLRYGVDVDVYDNRERTPLHYIVSGAYYDSMDGATYALLDAGADPGHEDVDSVSPLDIARQLGRDDVLTQAHRHNRPVPP